MTDINPAADFRFRENKSALLTYLAAGAETLDPGQLLISNGASKHIKWDGRAETIRLTEQWSGGAAAKAFTVTGAKVGDKVQATLKTKPTQAGYISQAVVTDDDEVTVTLSAANTGNDAVVEIEVSTPNKGGVLSVVANEKVIAGAGDIKMRCCISGDINGRYVKISGGSLGSLTVEQINMLRKSGFIVVDTDKLQYAGDGA